MVGFESSKSRGRTSVTTVKCVGPAQVLLHLDFFMELDKAAIAGAVRIALREDVGLGDATTLACVSTDARSIASIRARESMVVAGLEFAEAAFRASSNALRIQRLAPEGAPIEPGTEVLRVEGPSRALLTGERVALNFLQRLSGIATLTHAFVQQLHGTRTVLLDTRKTTPGWRQWEKYAVQCGGGTNHRFGLDDLVLIKDNHLAALRGQKPNPVAVAVQRARQFFPALRVEVEADRLEQVRWAIEAGADIVLLDNFSLPELAEAVTWIAGRARTEASGGVRLDTVRAIAETGVDYVSVGALTHSARSMDLGLDFLDIDADEPLS